MLDLVRRAVPLAFLLGSLAGCSGGSDPSAEPFPEACHLPSPSGDLDVSEVPDEFVIDGAVVRNVADEPDLLIVALNVPAGIQETFDRYKDAFGTAAYDRIGEDFEGFEAELYLREKKTGNLVSLQVRRPNCNEASSVTINLNRVNKDAP